MLYINGGNSECFFTASRIFVLTSPLEEILSETECRQKGIVETVIKKDNTKPFQTIRLRRMAQRKFAVCVQYHSSSVLHG